MNSKSNCHRCNALIYEKDKFGPVNGRIYHKSCFKCLVCETSLSLKSYKNSQADINDKEVYCASHAPKAKALNQAVTGKWNQPVSETKSYNSPSLNRRSSGSVITNTVLDKAASSSSNSTVKAESEVSKALVESKKWSSRENLLAMNTPTVKSDGRVATLTKKWNSRENLVEATSSSTSSQQIKRNLSNSNLLNLDTNKGSRENLADLPSPSSSSSSYQIRRNNSNSNLLSSNYNAGSRENLVEASSSSFSSQQMRYSSSNTKGSRENLTDLDKPYDVTVNRTERRTSDYKRYDGRKNSGEILSPRVDVALSPATQRKNKVENTVVMAESSTVQIGVKPKLIVDDLGNGINYSKYMDEIKRKQYNYSDPKRNVTDLYLKSPNAGRKSGSTGDIFDKATLSPNEMAKGEKKKASVHNLINHELNFYESFNHATTGYINQEMQNEANRLNIISGRNKAATVGHSASKHYDHGALEKMFTNSRPDDHNIPADDTTKITVSFNTGDNCCSHLSVKDGNVPMIRTIPRDETNDSSARGTLTYAVNTTRGSKENLIQQKFASEFQMEKQYSKPKVDNIRHLGRLKISHTYVNQQLCITIEKAENLYKDKDDPLDPYVTMSLLPDSYKETTLNTLVAENSTNPNWNQKFIYGISLSHAKTKYLYLSVKDHNMASELLSTGLKLEALKLISLGEILIPLNNLQENVLYDQWYSLQEPSVVQDIILTKDL